MVFPFALTKILPANKFLDINICTSAFAPYHKICLDTIALFCKRISMKILLTFAINNKN